MVSEEKKNARDGGKRPGMRKGKPNRQDPPVRKEETGMEGLKGVCNGILRNLVRKKDELVFPDPAADRRLASRLVYDTLDHLIWLDYVLGQVMAREDTDIKLRNILRLGACQILGNRYGRPERRL